MSQAPPQDDPQDQVRVSVQVEVPPEHAFRVFTEQVDQWWKRGPKYRVSGQRRGVLCIEAGVGGRLFESVELPSGTRVFETGRVTAWDPPHRLVFEWRAVKFAAAETTEVEVRFEPSGEGTFVTVTHRGWSNIRDDHPVRHGLQTAAFLRWMGLWWGDLMASLREHVAE